MRPGRGRQGEDVDVPVRSFLEFSPAEKIGLRRSCRMRRSLSLYIFFNIDHAYFKGTLRLINPGVRYEIFVSICANGCDPDKCRFVR
jgi:hypothetical protein